MSGRVLITGVAGFTGRYMALELARAGYEVYGLSHHVPALNVPGVLACHECDLKNFNRIGQVIERVNPQIVIHLGAISSVVHGHVDEIYQTNLIGTRYLLEKLSAIADSLKVVLLASSANIYGNSRGGELNEETPPAPANDYGVSKIAMEYMARLFTDRLPLIMTRPFNYTGVGQRENFLLPKIVAHLRQRAEVIELGNTDVTRDFSDVRSVVACYRLLIENPQAVGGTFNICSGQAYSLTEIIAICEGFAGYKIKVRTNPAFVRENEVKMLLGNRDRLRSVIGTIPDIPLEETLRWMLGDGA